MFANNLLSSDNKAERENDTKNRQCSADRNEDESNYKKNDLRFVALSKDE